MPSCAKSVLYHLQRSPYVVNRMNPSNIFFFPCHYTKNFYAEDIKWLDDHKVKNENLSDKYIMFGIIGCENEIFVNHILLMANNTYTPVDRTNLHLPLEFLIPKLTLFS